jgi:NAD(P)-dependent dehydrogenase (short-subunit alcohol dehydrogenase family)
VINPGLRNRGVLVTGTDNPLGIGEAIATAFADAGAVPFRHRYESVNFEDPSSLPALFDDAERACGPVEILPVSRILNS